MGKSNTGIGWSPSSAAPSIGNGKAPQPRGMGQGKGNTKAPATKPVMNPTAKPKSIAAPITRPSGTGNSTSKGSVGKAGARSGSPGLG